MSVHTWPGHGPIDLSKLQLTYEQKLWLANQHLVHKVTVRELHEKYKIRIQRLWKYINGVKNGAYLQGGMGRPYLLDRKGVVSLLELLYQEPSTKDQELKDAILAQHKEVYTRRTEVNSNSNQQYKKMASGTVVRYARDIRGWSQAYTERRKEHERFDEKYILDNGEAWSGCKVM